MTGTTTLGGAPRLLGSAGPPEAARDARAVAWASSLVLVWALSGALVPLAARFSDAQVALFGILPLLALGALAIGLSRAGARRGVFLGGAVLLTLGLALVIGGHAAGPRGAMLASLLAPSAFLMMGLPPWLALAATTALLVALPLWAASRIHAIGLTIDATGQRARSLRLDARSLPARDASDLGAPATAQAWTLGLLARFAEGYHLPGFLLADTALSLARKPAMRVHADVEPLALARALEGAGARVEALPEGQLRVSLPTSRPDERLETRVAWSETSFPRLRASRMLDLDGTPEAVAALRRLLLTDAAHACVFSWSEPARRWELRVNALAAEALLAQSVEERGVLLEEAERLLAVLERRALCAEEMSLLAAWKGARLRASLATALVSGTPGAKREDRIAAPAPALAPELPHMMGAGGLDAARRLEFAPFWILPVQTPWGEREIAVDARTGKHDPAQSRALLATLDARAPVPFLDVGRGATFASAPTPTAALLRGLRETLPPGTRADGSAVEPPLECVYVPFVAHEGQRVNAATGDVVPLAHGA